jgi:hypothetical protein
MQSIRIIFLIISYNAFFLFSAVAVEVEPILQVGANNGLAAMGGKVSWGNFFQVLSVGYTPSENDDDNGITQLNLNTMWPEESRFKVGLGIHANFGEETFLYLPEQYPEGYYSQNAVMFSLDFGYRYKNIQVALSILDYNFELLYKTTRPMMILSSSSLGITYHFDSFEI